MSKKHKMKSKQHSTYVAPLKSPAPISLFTPKDAKLVMEISGVQIYGSSVFNLYQIPNLKLRIDVSGLPLSETQLVSGNAAARALMPLALFQKSEPIIAIDWADGSAHSLDKEWWDTLLRAIRNLPEGSSVAVCCVGGTGRTGTVLAILAGLSGQLGPDDNDLVEWLRAHYYNDAVESETQMWYIEDITGLMTFAYPSDYLYQSTVYPTGTQVTDTQVASQPQGVVTGPLGPPVSVGASDHTGS